VEWAETFTFSGPFAGILGDGRQLRVRGLDVFEVRDGLVVWESGWYGDGWMIDRLSSADPGVMPEPLSRGPAWSRRAIGEARLPTSSADTRETIDRLFAAAATGDTGRVLEWWAPRGALDDITIARRFAGHGELRPYLDEYYAAFPDLTFAPSLLVVDGPWALVEWAETCHFRARFDGVPPDGRELRLRAVDLFTVADGLVQTEASWYGDGWFRRRLTEDPSRLPSPLARGERW
jgi:predicted ester cyclase